MRVPVGDSGLCCCLFNIVQVLINSLVGCFCTGALGFVPFHIEFIIITTARWFELENLARCTTLYPKLDAGNHDKR